jgi:hypothetical protein
VSHKYSSLISEIVGQTHSQRRERDEKSYFAMIRGIQSESARTLMLTMLADEIEIRLSAMKILARNGSFRDQPTFTQGRERTTQGKK